jgi:hypothetical protein
MRGYSRQELEEMSLSRLRGLDIETKEQEALIQDVLDERLLELPPSRPIYRGDIPEIQTIEQERLWQQIIDKRTAQLKPNASLVDDLSETIELEPAVEQPAFDPLQIPLAEPTGEGEPVTFTGGVAPALQGAPVKKTVKKKLI